MPPQDANPTPSFGGFGFSTSRPLEFKFPDLVRQCEDELAAASLPAFPDKATVLRVHSIRNSAQHDARYPNETEVSDCRTYTRDFLSKLVSDVWAVPFETISVTDLIQHQEIRDHLRQAESALDQEEYEESVKAAAIGLAKALGHVTRVLVPFRLGPKSIIVEDMWGERLPDRELYSSVEWMEETLTYLSLGIGYSDHMRFRRIAGNTSFSIQGQASHPGMKKNINEADAKYIVAYCTDTVVHLESSVGDLKAPFGLKYRMWR